LYDAQNLVTKQKIFEKWGFENVRKKRAIDFLRHACCIGCPTRYRTRHFFNNFTAGWRTAAPCRNN